MLIADDDPQVLRVLEASLKKREYEVVTARDGLEAWNLLQEEDSPKIAILDWMMPEIEGLTLCRKIREHPSISPIYVLMLTGIDEKDQLVKALEAGADDFVTKPFHMEELMARVQVEMRIIALQGTLRERVKELEDMMAHVKRLEGLLPVCSYCKRIRDEDGYWEPMEVYISERSATKFTHTVCPECRDNTLIPELEETRRRKG